MVSGVSPGRPVGAELAECGDEPVHIVGLAAEAEAGTDRSVAGAEAGQQRVGAEPPVAYPDPVLCGQVRGDPGRRLAREGELRRPGRGPWYRARCGALARRPRLGPGPGGAAAPTQTVRQK